MTSSFTANPRVLKYSLSWASETWWRAAQSYPREWDFILAATGLTGAHMIKLIACNDPDWAVIKDFTHQIAKWHAQQASVHPAVDYIAYCYENTTQVLSSLLRLKRNLGSDRLRTYLTERISVLEYKSSE